jgi:Fe2+ transport system protein FeoA
MELTGLPNSQPAVSLSQLRPGQTGTIIRVGGRAAARRRLLEMGLVRGETIAVERVAPLGDPVEFTIKGYHLSLRRQDAAQIEVELKEEAE